MNAPIEPRPVDKTVRDGLHCAKTLIERQDFESAAELLTRLLQADLDAPLRARIQTNLAASLCMLAQAHAAETALALLDGAHALLIEALQHRQPSTEPADWASTRANLALMHLQRYRTTGDPGDILSAHLAIDGVEAMLQEADDPGLLDWIAAIRDHLVELRERRKGKRR